MKKGKRISIFLCMAILFLPGFVFANEKVEYQDIVAKVLGLETSDKVRIYLFHGDGCPHCAEADLFLEEIEKEYREIEVVRYEVWYNVENNNKLEKVKSYFLTSSRGVPFLVIGDQYFSGFNSSIKKQMKQQIFSYLGIEENTTLPETTSGSILSEPIKFLSLFVVVGAIVFVVFRKIQKKEL